ncbi:hypothetical protein ACHHYP_06237 [Achlya hypogyna]|uniref:Uncharacterized protein n=1 Tax=Achlya hypogyna TaxID=1202772 RepID=A0A1V9YUX6_ACHHY|nr:hypothetical protein ACHHYP_06237 [Achlya hypogyna]
MSLACVLAQPDLAEVIVGFISCPYAAIAFLKLLPSDCLSDALRSFLALAAELPPPQLWPRLRASITLSPGGAALASAALSEVGMLEIDTWRPTLLTPRGVAPVAVSAPVSLDVAQHWHGRRLHEVALTLQSTDTADAMAAVVAWLRTAPQLRVLHLRHEADVVDSHGLAVLWDAVVASGVTELDIANDTHDAFSEAMYAHLAMWLATGRARRLQLTALHVSSPEAVHRLVGCIQACTSLQSLDISYMDDVAAALFQAPLPLSLRKLSLNIARIRTADDLCAAVTGSRLTHLVLVNRTRQLGPTYDKTMAKVLGVLPAITSLEHVELTYISMGPRCRAALVLALPQLPSLQLLSLTCFGSTPHYLPSWLLPVLSRCPTLHRIALRNVHWSAADAADWPSASSVRHLCVRGCKFEGAIPPATVCCQDPAAPHSACHLGDPGRSVHGVDAGATAAYL